MKSTWLLVAGVAIGSLGTGTYLTQSKHHRVAANDDSTTADSRHSSAERPQRKALWPKWEPSEFENRPADAPDPRATPPEKSEAQSTATTRPLITNSPRPIGSDERPTDEQLAINADAVAYRANRELDRLTRLLDLSEEQQDRIFPILARSSTSFHPALSIQVGNAETRNATDLPAAASGNDPEVAAADGNQPLQAKEAAEELHEVLTEDQQRSLEDALIEEDLWWTEIVNTLEEQLDDSTQITASEPEETSYEGNSAIGDLLKQASEQAPAAGSGGK